ncbi:MAG: exodeoxyribonuclease VII small subunit [Anaerolineaceae bacterium]
MTKPETAIEKMSYEEAFAHLEEVVQNLETEQLSLEDAIKNFERGQLLSKRCTALLEQADLKIRELTVQDMNALSE